MSEWWTYGLTDFLLFSPQTYFRLFELYNAALWPAHIAAVAAGVAIALLVRRGGAVYGRLAVGLLAVCWLWVAWGFLYTRYATINWAATYAAAAFAVQALLLIGVGVVGGRLRFGEVGAWRRRAGLGLYGFALLVQPLIGPLVGRPWSQVQIFGLMPDPTAVATLGVLLLIPHGLRWLLLVIPVVWCAFSGATLWAMDEPDALVLPAAALLALAVSALAVARPRQS